MPRAVITGGAGFLGSHLCERLVSEGWEVLAFDSLLTGDARNLASVLSHPRFMLEDYDVTHFVYVAGDVDWVLHFASPASPLDYLMHPIHTLKVGALGTLRTLGLAKAKGAGFMLASTSEVYGDPQVHPQPESYWGNVNPIGPRGVYDEAKRHAEALAMAYNRVHSVPVKIARIFNTFGPRMRMEDGRAVPTFIRQGLRGDPLTVHGDGSQTRSLCYVDDLVEGLYRFLESDLEGVANIGNPEEHTINAVAELIVELTGGRSELKHVERPIDDPEVRCPDIALVREALGWGPLVSLKEGLQRTVAWSDKAWSQEF
jgi:dTDP-glucose 4,6-dehydratase